MTADARRSYLPIADHTLIGNQHTAALVGADGTIDWCCFPELQDGSVFAAILDHRKGGHFRVAAVGSTTRSQHYIEHTGASVVSFEAPGGRLSVIDFMPIRGSIVGCGGAEAPAEIHRILHCEAGSVEVDVAWAPRFDYARGTTTIERAEGGFIATGGGRRLVLAGVEDGRVEAGEYGPEGRATVSMTAGQRLVLVTRYDSADTSVDAAASERMLRDTEQAWRDWTRVGGSDDDYGWAGAHLPLLYRSVIVLKMLTHPRTGAIAAAATASLPEWIGGVRNWDYRYAWIRDVSFTVQALIALGHAQEARDFVEFAERAAMDEDGSGHTVKLMYDMHGRMAPEEVELEHLEGYRESSPVRIGNGARDQTQHDVYGELIDCAHELVRRGEALEPDIYPFLSRLADQACEVRGEPDHGIWEFRGEAKHYTYSQLMIWVALDRAVRMADQYGLQGNVERWRTSRDALREDILERGYNAEVGAFVMYYGSRELDAANLRMPLLEFLPCSDPRVQGTIDRTLEQLTKNDMVYRYLMDDGLPGHEGTFGLCTFWMVQVLALSGRLAEARRIFEGMVARINPVGLYSEEIHPDTGEFLGNFPQAFTHVGLINAALYLAAAEGHESRFLADLEGMPSQCPPPGPARGDREASTLASRDRS
jgi:GH15 family glucan-1,4-alpha-glucosidase